MGGGLFGTPLYLNPKCLVFSGFVLAVYWMPHPNPLAHRILTAFMLATLSYVLLAWYDMIYDCNDKLGPTLLGWLSMPFKPSSYRDQFNELPVKYQKIVQWTDILILSVLLVLFVYPFIFTKR
jgi:UDP-N-acetylmuramyl pentapeptide phosphotransferase/UDP-N-acetylglucosamine-1-phosphate transferase